MHEPDRKLRLLGWSLHGLGLAVALAIAGLGYALAMRPEHREAAACRAQVEELNARLLDAERVRAEHRDLGRAAAEADRKAALLDQQVPREPSEAEFLSQASNAATAAGLEIRDYRPGVVRTRENHSELEIQLACAGPYQGLCEFLDRLASLPRLSRVLHIEVSAAEDGAYPVTMSLAVYFNLTDRGTGFQPVAEPQTTSAASPAAPLPEAR
jgi:Tfp pilus assembly protein PilO